MAVLLLALCAMPAGTGRAVAQDGESVGGALRGPDGEPVAGVTIVVTQGGHEAGTATTSADGTWRVPVPVPGNYDVTLDTNSLPEGVGLRDASAATLPGVTIRPGQHRTVLFPLAASGDGAAPGAGPGAAGLRRRPPPAPGRSWDPRWSGWRCPGSCSVRSSRSPRSGCRWSSGPPA